MKETVARAVEAIKAAHSGAFPKTVLVLGSGLGGFGEKDETEAEISYKDIPGFPQSKARQSPRQILP